MLTVERHLCWWFLGIHASDCHWFILVIVRGVNIFLHIFLHWWLFGFPLWLSGTCVSLLAVQLVAVIVTYRWLLGIVACDCQGLCCTFCSVFPSTLCCRCRGPCRRPSKPKWHHGGAVSWCGTLLITFFSAHFWSVIKGKVVLTQGINLLASVCSVWPSAWLCFGDWWGWSFSSCGTAGMVMSSVHQVWPNPSYEAQWKGEEDKADRGRGGKTISGNGRAWSLQSPRGQWRTGKNGGNWLWNHLWCPSDPCS